MTFPRRLVLVLALAPSVALAWGFDGHRRLASKMQDVLPANHCLKAWFTSKQTTTLQDKACDPDRWRTTDPAEAPRHYVEVDWVSPITDYPRDWAQAQVVLGNYALKDGTVPWRVEEYYGKLVAAFKTKDPAIITTTAFVMSHYVTDSFSVLHDTKNADPNNGLHARWESDMLGVTSQLNAITTLSQSYYGTPGKADPRNNVFDIVMVGNGLVNTLVAADANSAGNATTFYNSVKDLTARRWGDALTLMASLLWSAWAEAGSPELTGFSSTCSRAAPTAEIVLTGYPVPGGFTHPASGMDGGVPPETDVDAGVDADGGTVDPGADPNAPVGCGCQSTGGVVGPLALALALAVGRRRLAAARR